MVHGAVSENEVALARAAYEAYSAESGGRSIITGARLPEWDGVPTLVKRAWLAASAGVLRTVRELEGSDAGTEEAPAAGGDSVDEHEEPAPGGETTGESGTVERAEEEDTDDGLDAMTASELRSLAATELQLPLPSSATKSTMVERIRAERAKNAADQQDY